MKPPLRASRFLCCRGLATDCELILHCSQSLRTTCGRLGEPVTLEETQALYQSVTVWNIFAYTENALPCVLTNLLKVLPSQLLPLYELHVRQNLSRELNGLVETFSPP
ncbi:hypothetical protein Bca101_010472 [Brassica carinata]